MRLTEPTEPLRPNGPFTPASAFDGEVALRYAIRKQRAWQAEGLCPELGALLDAWELSIGMRVNLETGQLEELMIRTSPLANFVMAS